ncbi:MAG: hypothetical protein CVT59_11175 [Actinobacteria bacterium HGW-Actinobacteria-1]|jgi:hypothetical protein|nr:MAG: hypothetical protein CVT59_11175 [Actinobacteria bacterium HGW-Actinobacteria-1]
MAINKQSAPMWTKVVIVFVAVTFVASIALVGFSGFGGSSNNNNANTTGAAGVGFAATYQPQVDAALTASKSDPTNEALLANVGHTYYEWAVAEYESGAQDASRPYWLSAVTYYDQALALNPKDNIVIGNKAFALTYAGSPDAQAALEAFIATNDPTLTAQIENAKQLLSQITSSATGSAPASGTP